VALACRLQGLQLALGQLLEFLGGKVKENKIKVIKNKKK